MCLLSVVRALFGLILIVGVVLLYVVLNLCVVMWVCYFAVVNVTGLLGFEFGVLLTLSACKLRWLFTLVGIVLLYEFRG